MDREKVILLNPFSKKLCMRDYYCSKISKTTYYYHPIDFVILSGILSQHFDVFVIDCIAEKLSLRETLSRVLAINPDVIIFLAGIVSMREDMLFIEKIKSASKALMVGIGDIFLEHGNELLEKNKFIDAVLFDFTTNDIVQFIKNKDLPYCNIIYRKEKDIINTKEFHGSGLFSIPMPRHELFKNHKYKFPFARHKPFVTVITDFGCPFKCSYCVVNRFGYKKRTIIEVMDELKFINKLKIKEIVFKDQTFAAEKERAFSLCEEVIKNNINISWTCFSRVDVLDEKLLLKMKKAGCHTIIFGIETLNHELLSIFNREIDLKIIKEMFTLCRRLCIETVGTFIIGLPGDNKEKIKETIAFSKRINCDYASFNIFTPSYGTEIRKELIASSLIKNELTMMDSGISYPVVETKNLSRAKVWSLRKKALSAFYFRPFYLINKLNSPHSLLDLKDKLRDWLSILRSFILG